MRGPGNAHSRVHDGACKLRTRRIPWTQTQEDIVRAIAEKVHSGQMDKAGIPFGHPAHVAVSVVGDKDVPYMD